MFYSEAILAKKGPLAKVWLAAHWEKKLSKAQFLQTNIEKTVNAIVDQGHGPMALRLTGQLLLGIVRIYSRQARYLLDDCNEALVKIKLAFSPANVDMTADHKSSTKKAAQLTLAESITPFDLLNVDPDFDFNKDVEMMQPSNFTVSQNLFENNMFDALEPIEVGRGESVTENILTQNIQDEGIDLGIDIDDDIEVGRRAEPPLADQFQSPTSVNLNLTPEKDDGRISPIDQGFHSPELNSPGLHNEKMLDLLNGRGSAQTDVARVAPSRLSRKPIAQLDLVIELTGQQVKHQLNNVSAITKKHESMPRGQEALSLLVRNKYLENIFSQLENPKLAGIFTEKALLAGSLHQKHSDDDREYSPSKRVRTGEIEDIPMFDDGVGFGQDIDEVGQPAENGIVFDAEVDIASQEQDDLSTVEKFPMCQTLRDALPEEDDDAEVSFSQITEGLKRSQAAQAFYETLLLATKNAVQVSQEVSYGDISIKALPQLFTV